MQKHGLHSKVTTLSILLLRSVLVAGLLFLTPSALPSQADPAVDDFNPGADINAVAFVVQPDGKILAGGAFTTLAGQTRDRIGRLNSDGGLDASFNPSALPYIDTITLQPDEKILVGGELMTVTGYTRPGIGRLNSDGSIDAAFDPEANGWVYPIVIQPDNKILVGGFFTEMGGQSRHHIARLNSDGSLDPSFNPGAEAASEPFAVNTIALQPDGKILVGGGFTTLAGSPRNFIGRLNADGSLDEDFNPGANAPVQVLALQPDGKILVGGEFTALGGGTGVTTRNYIGRLNPDGSLDPTFDPGASSTVFSIALQADGKMIVAGQFNDLGGGGTGMTTANHLARLNPDGSLDTTFDLGATCVYTHTYDCRGYVYGIVLQEDGKIVVGGEFDTLGDQPRAILGRLSNDTASHILSLENDGSDLTWMRSGSTPEVGRVAFEMSTDGSTYTLLGYGCRISGGWRLSGLDLPRDQTLYLRARGYYGAGYHNASGSFAEDVITVNIPSTDLRINGAVNPVSPVVGQPVTYTLSFDNHGGFANNVQITATIPSEILVGNLTSQGALITCTHAASPYTWQVQDLQNGEGGEITITGSIDPGAPPGVTNINAAIASTTSESNPANNSDTTLWTIGKASTSTTLATSAATPLVFGQPASFTATVHTLPPGAGAPTGEITFTLNGGAGTLLRSTSLNASGQGVLSTNTLAVGTTSVSASYAGDIGRQTSVSNEIEIVVEKADTHLSLATSAKTVQDWDAPVTFTATVTTVAPGRGVPTGVVSFTIDGVHKEQALNANGVAVIKTVAANSASHLIQSQYIGSQNYKPSLAAISFNGYRAYIPMIQFE